MGLEEGLDDDAISGTNGLLTGTKLPNNNVTTATTFALFISQFSASAASMAGTRRSKATSAPSWGRRPTATRRRRIRRPRISRRSMS